MGRNNKQRRAAKKRERDRRRVRDRSVGGDGGDPTGDGGRSIGDGGGPTGDVRFDIGDPFTGGDPLSDDAWPDDLSDNDSPDDSRFGSDRIGDGASSSFTDRRGPRARVIDVRALLGTIVADPGTVRARSAAQALIDAGFDLRVWGAATAELLAVLDVLYQRGWQPADLMHVAGKKLDSCGQLLIARIIQHDSARRDYAARAPKEWCDQIDAVRDTHGPVPSGDPGAIRWSFVAGRGLAGSWDDVVAALTMMTRLPVLQTLIDPPSRWPRVRVDRPPSEGPHRDRHRRRADGLASDGTHQHATPREHDPKMLARIRALLAKAESTEFPDEAEALTGKAQALMSRYAIDEAVLAEGAGASGGSDVHARRVRVDSPYASTKVQLLASVGVANRVRVIWLGDLDMATVVGFPLELDLVEMLYTSLLVQATRAMTEAGRESPGSRSRSFRRAFLLAYAHRIGERLAQASADETADAAARTAGSELVLARRSQEVDDEFDRLFPRSRTMRTTRVDARGWYAGRDAADRATLPRERLDPGDR